MGISSKFSNLLATPSQWSRASQTTQGGWWESGRKWLDYVTSDNAQKSGRSEHGSALKWGTGNHALLWPSKAAVEVEVEASSLKRDWNAHSAVEYESEIEAKSVIDFPSCTGGNDGNDAHWRYLAQVGNWIRFAKSANGATAGAAQLERGAKKPDATSTDWHQFLRDHVRRLLFLLIIIVVSFISGF
jgi:hypothetical protein